MKIIFYLSLFISCNLIALDKEIAENIVLRYKYPNNSIVYYGFIHDHLIEATKTTNSYTLKELYQSANGSFSSIKLSPKHAQVYWNQLEARYNKQENKK